MKIVPSYLLISLFTTLASAKFLLPKPRPFCGPLSCDTGYITVTDINTGLPLGLVSSYYLQSKVPPSLSSINYDWFTITANPSEAILVQLPSVNVRQKKVGGGPAFGLKIVNPPDNRHEWLGGELPTGPQGPSDIGKGQGTYAYLTGAIQGNAGPPSPSVVAQTGEGTWAGESRIWHLSCSSHFGVKWVNADGTSAVAHAFYYPRDQPSIPDNDQDWLGIYGDQQAFETGTSGTKLVSFPVILKFVPKQVC